MCIVIYNHGQKFIRAIGEPAAFLAEKEREREGEEGFSEMESYPERFPYLCGKEAGAPGFSMGPFLHPVHPSFAGNNDNFVMWANLPNCGIVSRCR